MQVQRHEASSSLGLHRSLLDKLLPDVQQGIAAYQKRITATQTCQKKIVMVAHELSSKYPCIQLARESTSMLSLLEKDRSDSDMPEKDCDGGI